MSTIKSNQQIIYVYWDNYMKHKYIVWAKQISYVCYSTWYIYLPLELKKLNNQLFSPLVLFYAVLHNLCS